MTIWAPLAFDLYGAPIGPVAPPVLRVMGGTASPAQMAMAKTQFARFCDTARASAAPNPTGSGNLTDGSPYYIQVVGNSVFMTIWPSTQDLRTSGIQFDLQTSEGIKSFLLIPQAMAGAKVHSGQFGVRKLAAALPGGVAVHSDRTGKNYVAYGKRRYVGLPIASDLTPMDTAAAAQASAMIDLSLDPGIDITDFATQGKLKSTHFRPGHAAFIHTDGDGKQFAMSVKFNAGSITTYVAPLEVAEPEVKEYETAMTQPRYLSVDEMGRGGMIRSHTEQGARWTNLWFSEQGCSVVRDVGSAEWGGLYEGTDDIVVQKDLHETGCVIGSYQSACEDAGVEGGVYEDGFSVYHSATTTTMCAYATGRSIPVPGGTIAGPPLKQYKDLETVEKRTAGYLRDSALIDKDYKRVESLVWKSSGIFRSTETQQLVKRDGMPSVCVLSHEHYRQGPWERATVVTEGGVDLMNYSRVVHYDDSFASEMESESCSGGAPVEYDHGLLRIKNTDRQPLFDDPVTGIKVFFDTVGEYSGKAESENAMEEYDLEESLHLILTRGETELYDFTVPKNFAPQVSWARDPRTEVAVLHIYSPEEGSPSDSWSFVISHSLCVSLDSVLGGLGVAYTGDIIRNSNFLTV